MRQGDTVVVHSMDRLARNLDDLRRVVQGLTKRGVRIEFLKEHLVFTGEDSPMANLMLSVMGAFAEFERALIRERQREGIALAKRRGAYRGRKRSLNDEQVAELRRRIEAGEAEGEGRPRLRDQSRDALSISACDPVSHAASFDPLRRRTREPAGPRPTIRMISSATTPSASPTCRSSVNVAVRPTGWASPCSSATCATRA